MLTATGRYYLQNSLRTVAVMTTILPRKTLKKVRNITYNPNNTVIIFGAPRSGTTWLANIISKATHSEVIFEPFSPMAKGLFLPVKSATSTHWAKPYVRNSDQLNSLYDIDAILNGHNLKLWSEIGNVSIFPRQNLVLKTIHGSLIIPEIYQLYQNKLIYIERNPYAVVCSQLNSFGGKQYQYLNGLLKNQLLVQDWLKPWLRELSSIHCLVEEYAAVLAIETYITKNKMKGIPYKKVSYESLVLDPENQLKTILDWVAKAYRLDNINFNKQSFTSFTLKKKKRDLLDGWKTTLSRSEKALIKKWHNNFGLDNL
ncbi:MAG: sulfotransferase [Anaerolineae bacterium]|nr:sulfotransferase [Anaerolineae bacterium]